MDDFDQLKRLLVRADPGERRCRRSAFAALKSRARLWQGVHHRGEAAVFADAELSAEDRRAMASHFPAYAKTVSIPLLRLGPGAVFSPATRPEEWQAGDREETYLVVNILMADLAPGARIELRGKVASVLIGRLRVAPGPSCIDGAGAGHIQVLPTPTPLDTGIKGSLDGKRGADGVCGADGRPGRDCRVLPSVFGPQPTDLSPRAERDGGDGAVGSPGAAGGRGFTGRMCKTTEITVVRFLPDSGPLIVTSHADRGGHGGDGGAGGRGGLGGPGGRGAPGLIPPEPGGRPGADGFGGAGGRGGNGGRGGISSPLFLSVPADQTHFVVARSFPSRGGRAGRGGPAGGNGALPGTDGRAGRGRPGAEIFLNGARSGANPSPFDGAIEPSLEEFEP